MVTTAVTVFIQGLRRSTAAAIELLGITFSRIILSDPFSAYNHLPTKRSQLCWAHLTRDLTAFPERPLASIDFVVELLDLEQHLFGNLHHVKE